MKKILLVIIFFCLFLTGCNKYNQKNIVEDMNKKIKNGYKLSGNLSVVNNDETYDYTVDVSYNKGYYKVVLKNTLNDQKQVILKNKEGVYLLTPALNKSFRFQSDWPYNNSQIYLLDMLINDIKSDKKAVVKTNNNEIIIETKVNYPNNNSLKRQKIVLDKKLKPKAVKVYDKDGIEKMNIKFNKVSYSPKLTKDEFNIDKLVSKKNTETTKTGKLEDIVYPLFLPTGTKLTKEEKIEKQNGERVIMNYDGEKSFLLVEETTEVFNEFTVIPTIGEPYQLMDTLGVMTNNSLSWTSSGIDYYLVSDVMDTTELIEIAESITGTISSK
ncbi:MAG: outer membrane lipoprotein carrier protein LolA [Bacilli bacterium]|nr:outer membrane lipoprotein carrier protein LolA [Bacilli bacterium]